jgi:predicted metal-binding transcription factor (methanogenesis marker protein 9)
MDDLNNQNSMEAGDDFDAAEALLSRWKKDPSDNSASNQPDPDEDANDADDTNETAGDEGDNEQEDADEGDDQDQDPQEADGDEDGDEKNEGEVERKFADETAFIRVKVDGAEHEVSVKDLTRLWGQEASLTRKSQEVAQQNKVITERRSQYETALDKMYQKAVERAKPYKNIDLALAAKNLSSEDYMALKADAEAAYNDVKFFEEELKGHIGKVSKEAEEAHAKAATEAVQALTSKDSPSYIEGWSDTVYADLVEYGAKMGIPKEQMLNSVSAPSFKILWMAQQYEKSKAVATKKTTKVVGKKPINNKGPKSRDGDRPVNAMNRLKKSGSVDDAAMTLFERWGVSND